MSERSVKLMYKYPCHKFKYFLSIDGFIKVFKFIKVYYNMFNLKREQAI